ncbi:MAG TPA: GDP-mannose 4,6-dehydratase [Chitinophagaceae bacterium]|jgi:GDPmannose 4,6-dehydratase|nr:GDP-mannose 4,6-dehydratase [Chitinophagaceae bacterium]
MKKAIIIGSRGQDGRYLQSLLEERSFEVIAVDRAVGSATSAINHFEEICAIIRLHQPAYIFHLAANSTTSHTAWQENHDTISTGSLYVLEAIKLYSPDTKLFLSGSGLQFKNEGHPIKETDPFDAGSIYAVSRIHTVYAARYYRSLGLKVYIGYFFNHDSPYRTERHINRKILSAVQRIAKGSAEKILVGDLSVQKEFGFAGDIVKAIMTLVEQDTVYEAVIGTGVAHSIEEWISICCTLYGLQWQEHVQSNPGFRAEYKILVADPHTIFSLGWEPLVGIHQLAKLMAQ